MTNRIEFESHLYPWCPLCKQWCAPDNVDEAAGVDDEYEHIDCETVVEWRRPSASDAAADRADDDYTEAGGGGVSVDDRLLILAGVILQKAEACLEDAAADLDEAPGERCKLGRDSCLITATEIREFLMRLMQDD